MATSKTQRAFAMGGALLFLLTAVGTSVLVVWQVRQNNAQAPTADAQKLQDQINKQQESQVYGPMQGFTPIAKIDALQKIDTTEGTGNEVKASDTITVKYTGAYASDGQIFDSSDLHGGEPATFPLSGVIPGWTEGIPGMKVGGKRRLLIPANRAYEAPGLTRPAGFRANADLVFDIELVKIAQ